MPFLRSLPASVLDRRPLLFTRVRHGDVPFFDETTPRFVAWRQTVSRHSRMPLPLLADLYVDYSPSSRAIKYALSALAFLILARAISSTPSLKTKRVLHGRTIVISVGRRCRL